MIYFSAEATESLRAPSPSEKAAAQLIQLRALLLLISALTAVVDSHFCKLTKRERRARRRNRGIGSGNGERGAAQPLPARDCVGEWRAMPARAFLYQTGFFQNDFDDIVSEVRAAVAAPRQSGAADAADSGGGGRPRKLSIDNEVWTRNTALLNWCALNCRWQ